MQSGSGVVEVSLLLSWLDAGGSWWRGSSVSSHTHTHTAPAHDRAYLGSGGLCPCEAAQRGGGRVWTRPSLIKTCVRTSVMLLFIWKKQQQHQEADTGSCFWLRCRRS